MADDQERQSAHAEALRERDESASTKDVIDKEEPQNVGPNTKKDDPAHATERIKIEDPKYVKSKRGNKLSKCDLPTTGSNEPRRMNTRRKSDEPRVQ